MFIVGANMAFAHPILFRRLEDAKRARPEMKIIVADPRRTETAELADLYLPLLPGTDVALFNSLLNVLLWEGLTDRGFIASHTTGFDTLRDRARDFTPKENREVVRHRRGRSAAGRALVRRRADALALLPRAEPEQQRHCEERGADQPASGDRGRSARSVRGRSR